MDIDKYIDQRTAPAERPHFTREVQSSGPVRSRQVYINHENDWMLRALVKSQKEHYMTGGVTTTKDQLVDTILTGYLHHHFPELAELFKERQAIDNKAVEAAKAKPQ